MKPHITLTFALLISTAQTAQSQQQVSPAQGPNANALESMCMVTNDMPEEKMTKYHWAGFGKCMGIIDTLVLLSEVAGKICPSPSQRKDIHGLATISLSNYLRQNPNERGQSGVVAMSDALLAAFPCSKK